MIICRIAAVQPQTAGVLPGVAEESKSYTVKMLSEADVFLTIINYNWLCPQTQFQPLYQKHYGPITQLCKRKKKKCGEGQSESNRCSFTSSLNWFVDFFIFFLGRTRLEWFFDILFPERGIWSHSHVLMEQLSRDLAGSLIWLPQSLLLINWRNSG